MSRIIFTVVNDLTYDQRMMRICGSLAHAGHTVLLVGRQLPDSLPLNNTSYRQHRLSLFFRKGKLFYFEYNVRLLCFLLFKKYDICCGIDLDTILPCYLVSTWRGKKCVYDAHELFSEVPEVARRPFIQKIWRLVEKFSIGRIRNCYTVSDGLADFFRQKYKRHFEVIRNVPLLEDAYLAEAVPNTQKYILYQGALNEGRGLPQLIGAMKELQLQLKLAGEGDLSAELKEMARQSGYPEQIEFLGLKQPAALKLLTQSCYIGVNLLENNGLSYYYSLANKFFDYVHAGVPVITMNFPEYSKLNQQFEVAVLVNDLQKDTIVHAITLLEQDKDAYFRLKNNCLRARSTWNWQQEERKLLAFYLALQ